MELLLAAIIFIESGGDPTVIGRHGERGPAQIKRVYWNDACEQLVREGTPRSRLPRYDSQVCDVKASKTIVQAYWRRHCSQALRDLDWERLARVHNGGPTGNTKVSTQGYWRRVRGTMWRLESEARLASRPAAGRSPRTPKDSPEAGLTVAALPATAESSDGSPNATSSPAQDPPYGLVALAGSSLPLLLVAIRLGTVRRRR